MTEATKRMSAERLMDDIEQAIHDLETWGAAYPTDIFPEPTKEQIEAMLAVTAPADGVARVAAANARHLYRVRGPALIDLIKRLDAERTKLTAELEAARATALEEAANWMRDRFDTEQESLLEGLQTDAGLTGKDRAAMRAQLDAIDVWREEFSEALRIRALKSTPPPQEKST